MRSIILICYLFALFGHLSAEEPIVVRLPTESRRLPLYLAHFIADSDLDSSYSTKLEQILKFDLDHSGMVYLLTPTEEKEKLAISSSLALTPSSSGWHALKALYVIKAAIQNNKLSVCVFAANSASIKRIDNLPLSGDLARDRRQIHQLADRIIKGLFDVEGIASTRFLYTVKTKRGKTWSSEVWEADYDGENRRQLTHDSGYSVTPLYIPPKPGYTSGAFFFVSYKTGQPKIYYQILNENIQARRLTYLSGNQLMPTISRQRDQLAFISDVTGNPDLFMQAFSPEEGAIGKPYQIFSTHLATQGTPAFSPDGSQIAFVSNKDGSPRIYVMPVPTPGTSLKDIKATLISKRNKESTAPAWSPDGTKIAFCAAVQGVRQIWMYDFVTREERQLTQGPGNKENPSWAPNSLHLIFNSSDANACEVYLINLNQPDVTRLTFGEGEKRFPNWEPR